MWFNFNLLNFLYQYEVSINVVVAVGFHSSQNTNLLHDESIEIHQNMFSEVDSLLHINDADDGKEHLKKKLQFSVKNEITFFTQIPISNTILCACKR